MSDDQAPHNPMVLRGNFAGSLIRHSFVPGMDMAGIEGEDHGMPDNVAPGTVLDGAHVIRLTAARTIMPGSSLVDAKTPRANFQKASLGPDGATVTNGRGWDATGGFFEESDLTDMAVDAGTIFHGAHLQESRRGGMDLHSENLVGADFGPSGPGKGQPRKASRITAATQARAEQTLGGA